MTPSPTSLLFDMDGVLVKSEEVWFRLVEEAGLLFRGKAVSRAEFAPTFGQGTAADVVHFGFQCTPQMLDAFYVENFHRHVEATWVNPQAAELLRNLRAGGKSLAVVTNTVSPLAETILKNAGLRDFFDVVACADHVAFAKPAPDIVLYACEKLQTSPSSAWMVGDSRFDREAAKFARVHFVGLGIDGDARIEELLQLGNLLRLATES